MNLSVQQEEFEIDIRPERTSNHPPPSVITVFMLKSLASPCTLPLACTWLGGEVAERSLTVA